MSKHGQKIIDNRWDKNRMVKEIEGWYLKLYKQKISCKDRN